MPVVPQHKVEELQAQIDEAGLEASMTYSLADAIREGSSVTDQAIGSWVDEDESVCALSAAEIAARAHRFI